MSVLDEALQLREKIFGIPELFINEGYEQAQACKKYADLLNRFNHLRMQLPGWAQAVGEVNKVVAAYHYFGYAMSATEDNTLPRWDLYKFPSNSIYKDPNQPRYFLGPLWGNRPELIRYGHGNLRCPLCSTATGREKDGALQCIIGTAAGYQRILDLRRQFVGSGNTNGNIPAFYYSHRQYLFNKSRYTGALMADRFLVPTSGHLPVKANMLPYMYPEYKLAHYGVTPAELTQLKSYIQNAQSELRELGKYLVAYYKGMQKLVQTYLDQYEAAFTQIDKQLESMSKKSDQELCSIIKAHYVECAWHPYPQQVESATKWMCERPENTRRVIRQIRQCMHAEKELTEGFWKRYLDKLLSVLHGANVDRFLTSVGLETTVTPSTSPLSIIPPSATSPAAPSSSTQPRTGTISAPTSVTRVSSWFEEHKKELLLAGGAIVVIYILGKGK